MLNVASKPEPNVQNPAPAAPRFVVLRHEPGPASQRPLHWDFMIETDGVLRTWALADEPTAGPSITGQALADHRLAYLDFEGPISDGRGAVAQWDWGTYRVIGESAASLSLELTGQRLHGVVELQRDAGPDDHWTFRFSSGRDAMSA